MRIALALAWLVGGCAQRVTLPPPTLPLTVTPNAPFRADPPAQRPSPPRVPEVKSVVLANGMTILVVERPDLPLVSLAYASRAAHDNGAPSGAGLAELTAQVLNEGTHFGDVAGPRRLRIAGSFPVAQVTADGTSVRINSLSSEVEGSVKLLAASVRQPAFGTKGLEKARGNALIRIHYEQLSIRAELRDAALVALRGPGHPPEGAPIGSDENVSHFTLEAVKGFYSSRYTPESSVLVVVGAVTEGEVVALAERYFGDWQKSPHPSPLSVPPVGYLPQSGPIQGLEGSEAQARFTLALPCPIMSDPRGVDFDLLAMILANLSLSRSKRLLRHEQGIAYATDARCEQHPGYGTFWVDFAVETERGGDALSTVLTEIQRLRTANVSEQELSTAKTRLLAQIAAIVSTDEGLAGALIAHYEHGLPPDYYAIWMRQIDAATADELRESAARYFAGHIGVAVYGIRPLLEPYLAHFGRAQWAQIHPTDE